MRDREAIDVVLEKVKRPLAELRYRMRLLEESSQGTWLYGAKGSHWTRTAPQDSGLLPFDIIILVDGQSGFVLWWCDDPAHPRVEADVCLPPTRTSEGWRYVDVELDVVRHVETGLVSVDDQDEFDEACSEGHIPPEEARAAVAATEEARRLLATDGHPLVSEGWSRLALLQR